MRRFLLTIFGLFVFTVSVVLVLDLVNVALITDSTVSPAYKMWRLFEAYPRDEIAVLGSSRAAHYVPARLSPNVFNYTLDGSGQGETLFLLEAVLKRRAMARSSSISTLGDLSVRRSRTWWATIGLFWATHECVRFCRRRSGASRHVSRAFAFMGRCAPA